jgi:folate-binding protein YgfZ
MRFYTDPRHPDLGLRAFVPHVLWNELPHPMMDPSPESLYHKTRMALGIPEGVYDLVHQQSIILEYGYHHMNALDWNKGCYMGQELMARTFHRGHIRKHLYRMTLASGTFPAKGSVLYHTPDQNPDHTPDEASQSQRMGYMGGHYDRHGLATLHEQLYDGGTHTLFLATDDVTADPFSVFLEPCF